MSIIKRDKATIRGLLAQLSELSGELDILASRPDLTVEDKELLTLLTASKSINLDRAVTVERLAQDISKLESNVLGASVKAIREYVLGAMQLGGPSTTLEELTVVNGGIALTYAPHTGVNGVLNYGCARLELEGQTHDLKLTATSDPYRYTLDAKGLPIDGERVSVQYLYHFAARDLNDLIGDMILDGLVLIQP